MSAIPTEFLIAAGIGLSFGLLIGYLIFGGILGAIRKKQALQAARREVESARQSERDRVSTLYNLISSMTATLKYDRVLDMALDLGGNALSSASGPPSDRLMSAVMLFGENENGNTDLHVATSRSLPTADRRLRLPGNSGVLARVIASGEPELVTEILQDRELNSFLAFRACKVVYALPLRTGLDVYGVLLFAHREPEFFDASRREVLDMLARQALIAIQNARLYNDLEREKERMMEIQEEARKKLARDLHDGPTQSVAALAMRVNFTRRLMERDSKAAAEELNKIEELARRTTKEIRHMLFTLRPLVLESEGLEAALQAMAEKMHETYDQKVIVQVESQVVPDLEMNKQTIIFYIAEEAVNNARKHAQAENIWVRLKLIQQDIALLEIQDNGVGFNVGAVDATYDRRGSLGMVNMRERTELVNGVLRIDSAEGKGTRIQVLIPMTDDAAERIRRGG